MVLPAQAAGRHSPFRIGDGLPASVRGAVKGRGEKAVTLWTDKEGRLRLSPLLEWAVDDVWQYLGRVNAGVIPSYSRFEETMQTYQAAGGISCVVVADAEMQKHPKPCSSRFGCWVCTAVREDKSLRQMIETDRDRYGCYCAAPRFRSTSI